MQNYSYKNCRAILLLAVFVLTASLGYAQTDTIKRYAEPTVYIGNNLLGGRQDKSIILAYPFVSAKANDGVEWSIVSYRVTFVRQVGGNGGVEDPPISVTGAEFTDQIISLIQTAPSGTNVEFTDIRIKSVAGTKTIVVPLMVRIK